MKIETLKQESWPPRSITITFETREELNAFAARMDIISTTVGHTTTFGAWNIDDDKSKAIWDKLTNLK